MSLCMSQRVEHVCRLKGRFFYRMVDDSLPQWIRTYPENAAPRTGDGLFPGEVIEVTQVCDSVCRFLSIAEKRVRGTFWKTLFCFSSALYEKTGRGPPEHLLSRSAVCQVGRSIGGACLCLPTARKVQQVLSLVVCSLAFV